jgi:glycogen debranching enzyme
MSQEIRRLESSGQLEYLGKRDDLTPLFEGSQKARDLARAIRSRLWLEDRKYYAYFLDANQVPVVHMEGLGESLLLLADGLENNHTRIQNLFDSTYRSPNGIPCLWPQFKTREKKRDAASYYHNGRIWPFVQGYWALAAARHGQVNVFEEELEHLLDLTYRANQTFAEFYELDGQFKWERRRQLWSDAGYLGMVIQGLFGVQLTEQGPGKKQLLNGIRFQPVKGRTLAGTTIKLERLVYRRATLTIHVLGSGSIIDTFSINGESRDDPFLSSKEEGQQLVEIKLKEHP